MNLKQLRKVRRELDEMRRHPQGRSSADLVRLAAALGRERWNRGSEPTYIRSGSPVLMPPLSIPQHSRDMPIGTARSIIDQLLSDCDEWEFFLIDEEGASSESEG